MSPHQLNIALISNNADRVKLIRSYLKHTHANLHNFGFKDVSLGRINVVEFDLIIFDGSSSNFFDLKEFYSLRLVSQKGQTPYLFLLSKEQEEYRTQIFRDEHSGFLVEPFEQIDFLSHTRFLVSLGQLEKKVYLYDNVMDSEKKIIHYLDSILQIPALSGCRSAEDFFFTLEHQFSQRMELTFSVEMVMFFEYDRQSDTLVYQKFGKNQSEVISRSVYQVKKSEVQSAFLDNNPVIFEKQGLLDPFVQELEETVGFEIHTLLFAPFNFLQKRQGGFTLINKLYRKSFSENDLALSMITQQKFVYQLESIFLVESGNREQLLPAIHESRKPATRDNLEQMFFRDILDRLQFGLLIFDQNTTLIFMNKFASSSLGVRLSENLQLADVLGMAALDEIRKILGRQNMPEIRQEMLVQLDSQRSLYIGYSVYDISDKKQKKFALTFLEISQTKRLQAEIIRMDRMASLGVLASGIAHEIRNPLAGIKAMAQTLEEELEGEEAWVEYVQRIVRQVNRLDELLKSFFSYAKPQRPNPVRCKIPDIVKEVLPLFQRKIKEHKITVKQIYSNDLKEVFVDFHQIEQVVFNLVINAIDAMEQGGTLTIRAHLPEETQVMIDRRQRIPKLFSDVYNQIIISDTGKGMDQNTMNNMYNPFYTTKSNGTGLGLSIVYQIILEHGGQITVDSEPDKGTDFKILLPVYVDKKGEN